MPLTQVIGYRGSGKTIFCLIMAFLYRMKIGKEIYANFCISNIADSVSVVKLK